MKKINPKKASNSLSVTLSARERGIREIRGAPRISSQLPPAQKRGVTRIDSLTTLHKQERLTDALQLIEDSGFCDDEAIFLLNWMVGGAR
jgi:hypothetical protein